MQELSLGRAKGTQSAGHKSSIFVLFLIFYFSDMIIQKWLGGSFFV
jgi:hypothetical protein